jgi:NTP pyrophosphatase (non-canonical NTP hydrolase)
MDGKHESEQKILEKAIKTYGSNLQVIVAIEELSELQKELCKYLRNNGNMNYIAEEMADVAIMLEQLTMIFGNEGSIAAWEKSKLERLEKRLEGEHEAD